MRSVLRTGFILLCALVVGAIGAAAVGALSDDGSPNTIPPVGGIHTAATVPAARRPANPDLTYHSLTACVLVDTRNAGGKFGPTTSRDYNARGSGSLASQGGSATGCGVPQSATTLFVNIGAIGPNAAGYIKAKPYNGAGAGAGAVNYLTLQNVGGVLNLPLAASSAAKDFTVTNTGSTTDVIVTVQGYYEMPLEAMFDINGNPFAGSTRITNGSKIGTGDYVVTFDREVEDCSAVASAYSVNYYAVTDTLSKNANQVEVKIFTSVGVAVSNTFYLHVSC